MKILNIYDFVSERMKIRPVTNAEWEQAMKELNKNPFGLTKRDLVGDIENFPMGVVVRMMEIAKQQRSETNLKLLKIMQTCITGLFDWSRTDEKRTFWPDVINYHKFDIFFKKYPEYERYNLD